MPKAPDAFRTISEVAAQLETPAHVLRFWESKFTQIRPVKGAGGRRYFRPDDIALLSGIKVLLHEQGMTIRGVQKLLRERGARYVATLSSLPWEGEADAAPPEAPQTDLLPFDEPEADPAPLQEPESEPEPEPAEVLRGPWGGEPVGELTLARLRAALAAADPARLRALGPRLAPLLARLHDVRTAPLRQAG